MQKAPRISDPTVPASVAFPYLRHRKRQRLVGDSVVYTGTIKCPPQNVRTVIGPNFSCRTAFSFFLRRTRSKWRLPGPLLHRIPSGPGRKIKNVEKSYRRKRICAEQIGQIVSSRNNVQRLATSVERRLVSKRDRDFTRGVWFSECRQS